MSANQEMGCFACGTNHPYGLGLRFQVDKSSQSAEGRTALDAGFAGADGIAHGGIVATLLDEAMVYASRSVTPLAATASLQVRYRQPTPVGQELVVRGWVISFRHGAVRCEGQITHNGQILAKAQATLLTT